MKNFKITRGKSEIVCATGKLVGCSRKFVVIGIYISPRCKAAQYQDALDRLSDGIRKIKDTFPDPLIMVGGDFNRAKLSDVLDQFPDLILTATPPTRGSAHLDLMATNFEDNLQSTDQFPPLITPDGAKSDHAVIVSKYSICQSDRFKTKKITVRPRTKKGEAIFNDLMTNQDWGVLKGSPTRMADKLEELTASMMDKAFPKKTLKLSRPTRRGSTLKLKRL